MIIDEEIRDLVTTCYRRAKDILNEHLDILHKLAELLLEKETVLGAELNSLIASMRPELAPSLTSSDHEEKV